MSIVGQVQDMIREMEAKNGRKPSRMAVGRDFAEALASEAYDLIPQTEPTRPVTREEFKAGFIRSVLQGASYVLGVRIEAGWAGG